MLPITNLKCGVEIPVFLIFFSMLLAAPISSNFLIYRTCYVLMGKNESDCAKLGVNTSDTTTIALEKKVQEVANYISMIMEIFSMIVPCIVCLFIGPYSDKKGRRNILILSIAGMVATSIIRVIVAMLPNLSPWFLALQIIPSIMSGGMPTFITIAFCYLVDDTKLDNRSMRIGFLEGALGLGMLSGLFLSSHVFKWIGYIGSFILCSVLQTIALLYTILFVAEAIQINRNAEAKFFTFEHIKEMWHVTFKPREGYNRTVLLGCLGAVVIHVFAIAFTATESLLLRSKFHWDLQMLTDFASIQSIFGIMGMCICIYVLHKLLKISESVLIAVGLCANAIGASIMAFAQYDWQVYTAAGIRIPAGLISPMIRSLTSNIIPQEETGKIFAFCISIESFCSLFAGPLSTIIYTETIDVFPGAFDLIPVMIYIGLALFFVYVYTLTKKPNAVIYLEEEDKTDKSVNIDASEITKI